MWNLFHICIYPKICPQKNKGEKNQYIDMEYLNTDVPWSKRLYLRFFINEGEKLISKSQSWKSPANMSLYGYLGSTSLHLQAFRLQMLSLWRQGGILGHKGSKQQQKENITPLSSAKMLFLTNFCTVCVHPTQTCCIVKWKLSFLFLFSCKYHKTTVVPHLPRKRNKEHS